MSSAESAVLATKSRLTLLRSTRSSAPRTVDSELNSYYSALLTSAVPLYSLTASASVGVLIIMLFRGAEVPMRTDSADYASSTSSAIEGLLMVSASISLTRAYIYVLNVLTRDRKSVDMIVSVESPAMMPYSYYNVTADDKSDEGSSPVSGLLPRSRLAESSVVLSVPATYCFIESLSNSIYESPVCGMRCVGPLGVSDPPSCHC